MWNLWAPILRHNPYNVASIFEIETVILSLKVELLRLSYFTNQSAMVLEPVSDHVYA